MDKKPSAWTRRAAALVASLLCGGAMSAPAEGRAAALDAAHGQKAYDSATPDPPDAGVPFDPAPVSAEGRGAVRRAVAARWDRLAATPGDGVADEIQVDTARAADGKTIEVAAQLALPVDPDVVWEVLNDFENMPHFVPDILATRLISSGQGKKRVGIEGVVHLLFLDFPIRTTLDVTYLPGGSIALNSVTGNLALNGIVRVYRDMPYTRVDYKARIAPDFWLPRLVGDYLIGRHIRRQFEGIVAEIHRRAASRQTRGLEGSDPAATGAAKAARR